MRSILPLFILCAVFISCEKENDSTTPAEQLRNGVFSGTFNRSGMDTANVMLDFTDNHFTGSSDRINYPAICGGRFEISGSDINFIDTCTWTANFDWTLILNGSYQITEQDNKVRISRTNGTTTDEYLLKRITR